jgi:GT2 family glycosyltransferase
VVTVSVIVLAFGPEPLLEECLRSVLGSEGVDVDVHLVDNGCTREDLARFAVLPRVRIHRPAHNLGFAGGVEYGARHADAEFLCLINSDAVVRSDAIARLIEGASDPSVGIVSGSVRLYRQPETINSAGNPLHLLGYAWSGGFGRPASEFDVRRQVAVASGAALVMRRQLWSELGGFDPRFFMYHEDVDLSLAAWQRGYTVEYVPDAVVLHDYHFGRTATKLYFAERNRLIVLLTRWPRHLLLAILPLLVLVEVGTVVVGGLPGLRGAKVRGWWWLARNGGWLLARRRANLAAAQDAGAFIGRLEAVFGSATPASGGLGGRVLDLVVPLYSRLLGLPIFKERS